MPRQARAEKHAISDCGILLRCESQGVGVTDADRLRVLTFYSAQVRSIQQAMPAGLAKPTALGGAVVAGGRNGSRGPTGGGGGVSVHTVDGSQGAESDIIVLSFVRSNARGNIGFVADARYARNIHLPMAVFTASKTT